MKSAVTLWLCVHKNSSYELSGCKAQSRKRADLYRWTWLVSEGFREKRKDLDVGLEGMEKSLDCCIKSQHGHLLSSAGKKKKY